MSEDKYNHKKTPLFYVHGAGKALQDTTKEILLHLFTSEIERIMNNKTYDCIYLKKEASVKSLIRQLCSFGFFD